MMNRGSIQRGAIAAAIAAGAFAASAARAEVLRVCADPDNLPFSKADGPERGLYVDLAELVGQRLGSPVEYVWWLTYYQRRALRNTILQDGCDAVFALPADAEYKTRGLQRTNAFLEVSYAVVGAPGVTFTGLGDLKGKRIAVQYGSTPQVMLAGQQGLDTRTYRTSDEVFEALDKGLVDVGFLWGPVAGYDNQRRFGNRWRVTPVTGLGLGGEVAVAVRKEKVALVAAINRALSELRPEIAALADKYGFPRAKPIPLSQAAVPLPGPAQALAPRVNTAFIKTAAAAQAEGVQAGRVRFNNICSHCHGSDGASPIRARDLRRLKARYDDNWPDTARTTIRNGRPDLGMPPWKDAIAEGDIEQVIGFLSTIQK